MLQISTGGAISIQLSDGPHVPGLSSTLTMTQAEYKTLRVLPPAEDHPNFTVTASITSYEVDDTGNPLSRVLGASSSISVQVNVRAVIRITTKAESFYENSQDRGNLSGSVGDL